MKSINWREAQLESASFNQKQEKLLKNVGQSLTKSWLFGVLYTRSKKLNGIRDKPFSDCSSTFQEWNKKVEDEDKKQQSLY